MTDDEMFNILQLAEEMSFQNWRTFKVLYNNKFKEAEDRIKQLENGFNEILAASQVMTFGPDVEKALHLMIATHRDIARAALKGKKDE